MKKVIVFCLASMVFMTGCWDKVEIENRIFISDIGVDLYQKDKMNRFIITYQYPNINAIGKNATESKKFFVLSTPSSSIFQASRELGTKSPSPFYFKHVKVLILGEKVLNEKNLVKEIIDELNRDTKVNKRLQIVVAEGKAMDMIEANAEQSHTVESAIHSTIVNNKHTGRFTPQTLIELLMDFDYCNATITPRIILKDNKYIISGGCIMKDYEHIGWICERENRAISLLKGKIRAETIDIFYKDNVVSYTITTTKSKKKVKIEDGIKVNFIVDIKGYLQGYTMAKDRSVYSDKVLKDMEKAYEKEIKGEMEAVIKKMQKTYKADVLGIGAYLSKFEPKTWGKIKDNWDNVFSDIEISIDLNVNIRGLGLMR